MLFICCGENWDIPGYWSNYWHHLTVPFKHIVKLPSESQCVALISLSSKQHVCNVVHAYSKLTLVQKHALTLISLAFATFNLSEPGKPAALWSLSPLFFFSNIVGHYPKFLYILNYQQKEVKFFFFSIINYRLSDIQWWRENMNTSLSNLAVSLSCCVQSPLGLWRLPLTLSRFPGSWGLRGAPRGQLCVTHGEQMFFCICCGRFWDALSVQTWPLTL